MKTKKMVFLGLMVGYSLVLYILETYIPNPFMVFFPGAKHHKRNFYNSYS